MAHYLKRHILGVHTRRKPTLQAHIDGLWNTKPGAPRCVGHPDIGRTHAGAKGAQRAISAGMAIGSYDDVTGHNIAALRHHLVADALLQDGDILFLRECADIAM